MKPVLLFSFFPGFPIHYFIKPFCYKRENIELSSFSSNSTFKNQFGKDGRYSDNESLNKTQLFDIHQFFEKYYVLSLLHDDYISVNVKLNTISDYYRDRSIIVGNLKAGGLFDDWV
jgi:hypothetical protein